MAKVVVKSGVGEKFASIADRVLPSVGAPLVLAVSGGADSMALWDLCVQLGRWRLVVWHLDHGLRADAAEDAALIVRQAAAYRAAGREPGEVVIERVALPALAKAWGVGVEMAGRRHRYARLIAVALAHQATVVCTAHHRDDQAETVLANLLRGAGPIGLMGIARRRVLGEGVSVARPLLDFSRSELREHLAANAIAWREDTTNTDQRFHRNRLRLRVLPALEKLAPGAAIALTRLAQRQRQRSAAPRSLARSIWNSALGDRRLTLTGGLAIDARYFLWRHLLLHLDAVLERPHLDRLDRLAGGPVGKRLHLGRWLLRRAPDALVWEEADPVHDLSTVTIAFPGAWQRGKQRLAISAAAPPSDPHGDASSAWLDADAVKLPLRWRVSAAGERWRPLGATGTQTITKTLAERRIPSRSRRSIPVFADDQGVVWIPGITIAERARIGPSTSSAWQLALLEDAPAAATVSPMPNPEVSAVILAAGKGTRMGSDLAKVLHQLAGKPLVSHVLDTCKVLGLGQSVVVVGHQREAVEALVKPIGAETALQDKQLGTGHAVLATKTVARGSTVLVLCGDCPMTPPALLEQVLTKHRASRAACTAVAARLADPAKYGRMITDPLTGRLARIVEWKDASEAERTVDLINSGIYAFNAADLWRCLERLKPDNAQGEYYLTDVVGMLVAEKRPVELVVTDDMAAVLGINTPADLAEAERLFAASRKSEAESRK